MGKSDAGDRLGTIDFATFIVSLASTVSVHLDPGHKAFDLSLAKETIDILAMLQEKTSGNRTAEEEKLLAALLYQTRLAYCDAAEKKG